jgi:rubrerythrin
MQQDVQVTTVRSAEFDYVQFWSAGDNAKGEFHCSECGYGVTVHRTLPQCPMCSGDSWEQSPWSPMSRARLGD